MKLIELFTKPRVRRLIEMDLYEAELKLLAAQAIAEDRQAAVSKAHADVAALQDRVTRLRGRLREEGESK